MPDPLIFDWRDAVSRLKAAKEQPTIDELLATVPPGADSSSCSSRCSATTARGGRQWTKLVWRKASDWSWLLEHDPRLQLVAHIRSDEIALKKNYFKPLQAFVYRRKR